LARLLALWVRFQVQLLVQLPAQMPPGWAAARLEWLQVLLQGRQ